ncbi:methyl-accepting chemotaxis sensory transducer, class 40+24H [Citrifermentans bemidjiense Bem]|uniref:Methyl-accepting chemotaxis sensory transducer, class 40+24H n=1 Tax=Citrifermentans bemidjiense (strain ATCC BAA-1014 / DSM 16622 / JCM 12645 / Bem) TaxID=404380 RepID=B5EB95_CITBB|nr:methyl-accepting chemotaxis protein [Citrifermentans bemidjiense]ACH40387.1 methyl-accepting chemotaxis sensory transducer, class 40+24H [Citrifermentans bemidjiense Bem]
MFFRKYLSSLRSTYIFMVCFGLLMGVVFPFYSWLFFGGNAFAPLYVFGCIAAGFIVGSFCYQIIKEALRVYVEHQLQTLYKITNDASAKVDLGKGDELKRLMECNEALMNRVLVMVENVSCLAADISDRQGRLTSDFSRTVDNNVQQAAKEKETIRAIDDMNAFFKDLLREIRDIASRTDERASISTQMSAATDAIALSIQEYSASVMETSGSIEEMAASIKGTSANIEALTTSTEQTFNSINGIGDSIVGIRDSARRTSDCSDKVRVQAVEGMAAMAATIAAMGEIEDHSDRSVNAIKRLSSHSLRVGEFLDVIKEVVSQTNLLSLNASIIAAQAGDRGKAFAVVAEEVRGLAQRTSASTEEIEELVLNIQKETVAAESAARLGKEKVAEGVKVSEKADAALHRIEESAAEASRMVQQIAAATDEQASGSRLITEEAEKNLSRVKQFSRAIQEEEAGAQLIVRSLDRMRGLSEKITLSTDEQARGNRLYLMSVQDDNDKVKRLKETCMEQIAIGEMLRNEVAEVDQLIEGTAEEAKQMLGEIETINNLINDMHREMESFRKL